ncbi:hypothetical protein BOTCAL_0275g00050 [Botryotinia calthae]|uniref:Uncharacterized protein n=1 Tax=Botryotinia calthae TaxID=38488 RepID=A0A4Y8CVM1_9HELO|nr:hypothetical protein BOTCAL_0275g00050 [Botryotinia calthae]
MRETRSRDSTRREGIATPTPFVFPPEGGTGSNTQLFWQPSEQKSSPVPQKPYSEQQTFKGQKVFSESASFPPARC